MTMVTYFNPPSWWDKRKVGSKIRAGMLRVGDKVKQGKKVGKVVQDSPEDRGPGSIMVKWKGGEYESFGYSDWDHLPSHQFIFLGGKK